PGVVGVAVPAAKQVGGGVGAAVVALPRPAVVEPLDRHGVLAGWGAVVGALGAQREAALGVRTALRPRGIACGRVDRVQDDERIRRRPAVDQHLAADREVCWAVRLRTAATGTEYQQVYQRLSQ